MTKEKTIFTNGCLTILKIDTQLSILTKG